MDAEDKANREAFEFIESLMAGKVLNVIGDQTVATQTALEQFLRNFISRIWPEVNALYLRGGQGFNEPPATLGVSWKELTAKTQKNKDRPYKSTFMRHWGDLKDAFASLAADPENSIRDFGTPGGKAQVRGASGKIYAEYTMDKRGRWRYAKGTKDLAGRGIGGRFVRIGLDEVSRARGEIGFGIQTVVDNMKRIDAKWMEEVVTKGFSVFNFGRKVGSRGGVQPARPFLIPFLDWYTSTHFEAEFSKRFG